MFNYAQLCLINVIVQTFSFKFFKKYFFFLSVLNFRTFEALPQTHDQVIVLAQLFDVVDLLHLLVHVADVEVEEDRRGDDGDDLETPESHVGNLGVLIIAEARATAVDGAAFEVSLFVAVHISSKGCDYDESEAEDEEIPNLTEDGAVLRHLRSDCVEKFKHL